MNDKGEASNGGAAIIEALEIDFYPATCDSIASCLFVQVYRRSKQRPAAVVQSLLADIHPESVKEAHYMLLQDYLKRENDNNTSQTWMKRVSAIVYFIQLLLACPSFMKSSSSSSSYSSSMDGISEQESQKMALDLLQKLFRTIKTMLQENQDQETNNNTNVKVLDAWTVACFTVGALVKAINPYVSSLPFLLSPLWKGISNICLLLEKLPNEVAETTLAALCVYLQEGQDQIMMTVLQYCTSQTVSPKQMFQVKVVTFLVARVAVILKVYLLSNRLEKAATASNDDDDENEDSKSNTNVLSNVVAILLQLRGLTLATRGWLKQQRCSKNQPQDESFLSAYQQLELKVEQCVVDCWLQVPSSNDSVKSTLFGRQDLNLLLRSQSSKRTPHKELILSSFAVGKALVLHRLLVQTVASLHSREKQTFVCNHDVQSLLMMIEELLFSALPQCSTLVIEDESTALLSKSLTAMASATVLCYFQGPVEKRGHLNILLVKWLAPSAADTELHPLTRELLVSLLPLHVLTCCQVAQVANARSDSPRSVDLRQSTSGSGETYFVTKSLVTLLVKLIFDFRTQTAHRRNIASVLIRLVVFQDATTDKESLQNNISVMLQQNIATEVQQIIKDDVKAERRKRKRGKSSKSNDSNSSHPALGSFAYDDVRAMAQVLKRVSAFELPSLASQLAGLARGLVAMDLNGTNLSYTIANYSRNAVSLLLSLLCGIMNESERIPESFKNKTGMEPGALVSSLVAWLGQQQHLAMSRPKGIKLRKSPSLVIVACLHFVQSSFDHVGMSVDLLRAIVDIVKGYCRVSCLVVQSNSQACEQDARRSVVSIVFAVAALLARTTKVILPSCPDDILQVRF